MFCSARVHSASAGRLTTPRRRRPPWLRGFAMWWATLVLATLVVAGLVKVAAPSWLSERDPHGISSLVRALVPAGVGTETVALPDDPLLAGDIFFNNFLLVLLPIVGGWLAANAAGRHRFVAPLLLGLPALVLARSLLTIGAIGGGDSRWLVDASRWWVLEVGALACSASVAVVLANERFAWQERLVAMRCGLGVSVLQLALAAALEVFTA
jgi:hypothetical protein